MTNNIETLIGQVDSLDDEIYKLEQSIADKKNALVSKREKMNDMLNDEIIKQAANDLKDKEYGCGTVNIDTGRHKVKLVVSKKVTWDQEGLADIRRKIVASGQNYHDYMQEKLTVTETAYKKFDPEIQDIFQTARTVEPSKPTIKIERK